MQLQYFGETFDRKLCARTCDNCANEARVELRDVSEHAKAIVEMGKHI